MKLEDLKRKDGEGNLCWFCSKCSSCKMDRPHECDDFAEQSQRVKLKQPEPVPGDFLFDRKGKTLSKGDSDEFGVKEAKVTLNTMVRHMGL